MKHIIFILVLVNLLGSKPCNAQKRIIGANVANIQAGEAIPNWSLVRISGGKAFLATSANINNIAVGIAIDTALAVNDMIQVAYSGTLQGFDIQKGADYFLGVSGASTATRQTTGFYQKVGQWVGDSTMQLNIQNPIQIINSEIFVNLASDASNSTVTLADLTGLSFTGEANTSYIVKLYGLASFAAVTTGIGIVADAPSDASVVAGRVSHQLATQTNTSMQQVVDAAIAGTTTTNGTGTSGNAAVGLNTFVDGVWLVTLVSGGTVKLQFRSEIATSNVTIRSGARMSYLKI